MVDLYAFCAYKIWLFDTNYTNSLFSVLYLVDDLFIYLVRW